MYIYMVTGSDEHNNNKYAGHGVTPKPKHLIV